MRSPQRVQPASAPAEPEIEGLIAKLGTLTIDALRARWRQEHRAEPPKGFTKDLLARALADRLQTKVYGTVCPKTAKLLREIGRGGETPRHIKVGSVIVREYDGALHEVVVVPGGFLWQGKTFGSLSQIAKKITGTSWNGPRFFGLRSKDLGSDAAARPPDPVAERSVVDRREAKGKALPRQALVRARIARSSDVGIVR